jgi:hypothetical protein
MADKFKLYFVSLCMLCTVLYNITQNFKVVTGRLDFARDLQKTGKPEKNLMPGIRLEVVSKPQIMFESKAQADEKAQHT